MTAQERLLDALRNHGSRVDDRNSPKVMAQCPSHDDNTPSLSIAPRDDGKGAKIHCFAGCDTTVVLQALGWTMADLFDDDKARDVFSPRRDYEYSDGRVVHRKPGKAFRQSGKTQGRSLFHAERIGDAKTVYVTEGEKCAEAIETLAGAVAVSPAMGAGKARLFDWEPLRDKDVVIVADRDEPGRKHAADIVQILHGVASQVRVAEAATGKDAADHLAAGKSLSEFVDVDLSGDALATPACPEEASTEDDKSARRSIAARLVELARADYLTVVDEQGAPYGVRRGSHIALPLRGGKTGLRAALAHRFYEESQMVPGQQALADACTVLEGAAAQDDPQRVHLRVAAHNGAVYVDMGDPTHRVVRITGGRWEIVESAPVLFRRTQLTGAFGEPAVAGTGDVSRLWNHVPVDEGDRPLILAWLIQAILQPDVPHPVLGLNAEHGSAKTTLTKRLVALADPSPVPVRKAPRDAEQWTTAAVASWIVALDNLSGTIPQWLSDAMCRASTGDGDVRRQLYTDGDVATVSFRRVVAFNGIDVAVTQGDLADRLLTATLPRITEDTRRTDEEVAQAWNKDYPVILAGLFDLAAKVHSVLPGIRLPQLPRMADYAGVLAAVDQITGTAGLPRYRDRAKASAADTLTASFIAALVECRYTCEERASKDILADLTPTAEGWRKPKDWPNNTKAASGQLTRHAPALRLQGWVVEHDDGKNIDNRMRWTLEPPEPEQAEKDGVPGSSDSSDSLSQINGHKSDELFDSGSLVGCAGSSSDELPTSQTSQQDSGSSSDSGPPTCDNESTSLTSHVPALSLLMSPIKVEGPDRCPECSFHPPTQGHRDNCSRGAA